VHIVNPSSSTADRPTTRIRRNSLLLFCGKSLLIFYPPFFAQPKATLTKNYVLGCMQKKASLAPSAEVLPILGHYWACVNPTLYQLFGRFACWLLPKTRVWIAPGRNQSTESNERLLAAC
jgi:hypothetical protein